MNKKGLSHVDWVMSMGIFLVYVLFLIVFIKPGGGPVYQSESLLDIVEIDFRNEFSSTIEKIPLFINGVIGNQKVSLEFPLKEKCDGCKFRVYKKDLTPVIFYSIGSGRLVIEDGFNDNNVFWIYSSRDFDYPASKVSGDRNPDLATIDLDNPPKGTSPSYYYGSGEVFKGFSEPKVRKFFKDLGKDCGKYEDIKKQLNYPPDSEFQFFFYDASKTPPELAEDYKYSCAEPSQQDNVYVRDFGTVVLKGDLTMYPIIVNIRIWQ